MNNIEIPTIQNTALQDSKIVFPVKYASPKKLSEIFGMSTSTVYRQLSEYENDNLGINDLYISLSATLKIINVERFEQYLMKKNKKWK
ncbi:helix-turn-helix domain-containing protein [Staphylococcus saprophyticus]|nr:helix-turn-helix domain-containing protein [Staphylococcus saprophyticus]MDW4112438.1 helix-turn-helix domain-containing protein [Staphylococcus saprophyticus]MDW4190038.1 helix-turn-helix domain-containing protein [Staphylococcus saprophyticus]MDW4193145.1 helix-turn-helix domain-containing protein [Staphylococcus saprophyticus]